MTESTVTVGKQLCCLIVEDQALIALDLESMLLAAGATQVATANTLEQADKLVKSQLFDAVFLEVQMGDLTTISLARKLRNDSVPVIFSTGSDIKSTLPEEFHRHAILGKPYSEHDVRQIVKNLLAQV